MSASAISRRPKAFMQQVLIQGASRDLGLQFTRRLLARDSVALQIKRLYELLSTQK